MEVVTRYALILQAHLRVAAAVAMCSPVMEELVRTSMSVQLTLTTASSAASIRLGHSDVHATQDSNSTLINEHVLVIRFYSVFKFIRDRPSYLAIMLCICRY